MSEFQLKDAREDSPYTLLAYITGEDDVAITQASMSAISFRVFQYDSLLEADEDDGGIEIGAVASLTVASVVLDTPLTNNGWEANTIGYNYRHVVPAARFPTGGKYIAIEYLFNPTAAGQEDYTERVIVFVKPRASG